MIIKLVRHGDSEANAGIVDPEAVGDCNVSLTSKGKQQAIEAGERIGKEFLKNSLLYYSPYLRTRQTLYYVLKGVGLTPTRSANGPKNSVRVFEDPRLREIERGYKDTRGQRDEQQKLRKLHNWFFFRFPNGGESPADGYDRCTGSIESMMRQAKRKEIDNLGVFTHGTLINCFAVRFLHLTIPQYCNIDTPENCGIVTIAHKQHIENPDYVSGKWAVSGLRFRNQEKREKELRELRNTDDNPLIWTTDNLAKWDDQ